LPWCATPVAFPIIATVGNRSAQPAEYAFVEIGLDPQLATILDGAYTRLGKRPDPRGISLNWFRLTVQLLACQYLEKPSKGSQNRIFIFGFHSSLLSDERLFDLAVNIAAPGFADTSYWTAKSRGASLRLYPPTHPFTKARTR